MEHPFEHRAHYNAKGEACHCPWGFDKGGEHLGSVHALLKEASKLEWLKSRPDLQNNEGQDWLRFLGEGNYAQEADKMLPYLTREWRKGRLVPNHTNGYLEYTDRTDGPLYISPQNAQNMQQSLEEMQKRGQGADVMQHKIHELIPKVQDFQDWKDSQGREGMGEVLHSFPDGWSVRRLKSPEEYADEGQRMGHCIGDKEGRNPYSEAGANGSKIHVSLRDHRNLPHATMELEPSAWGTPVDSDTYINEFYGKGDAPPLPEYHDRMAEWLEPKGVPMEWESNPEADMWHEEQHEASTVKPLYYRWVYSPSKGVTLGSNSDDHPAFVKYHQGLGGDINDTDLTHGYAYPIGNGWRVTDYEHKALEDPYIVNQVVRRLNHEESPQIVSEGSWQASEYDWDRLHYAIPRAVTYPL